MSRTNFETLLLFSLSAVWALSAILVQGSTVADPYYVAAVVEYNAEVRTSKNPEENMLENVRAFRGFVEEAKKQDADIIVFPEVGLHGFSNLPFYIEVPLQVIPCSPERNDSQPLRELSCMAADFKMYLVVNLREKFPCTPGGPNKDPRCPARGAFHYNTQVVFDRSGKTIARYRKYHLFGEATTDITPEVEHTTFNTDFGVRFGTFICFDILYDKPAVSLVRDEKITDFVFSTAWFSEVPFLTAVQAHSMFAHALDVTVLASGMNHPPVGSTGSGVYLGRRGVATGIMSSASASQLLVQRVPKAGRWDEAGVEVRAGLERFDPVFNYDSGVDPFVEMQPLAMLQDNLTVYATHLLGRPEVGQEVSVAERLCSAELCCRFQVTLRGADPATASSAAASLHGLGYSWRRGAFNKADAEDQFDGFHYRLAVFSGVRDHSGVASTGVQVCGVISCLSEELESCGWIAPNRGLHGTKWSEFVSLSITGVYEREHGLQMASTLAGPRYEPLPASTYTLESEPHDAGKQLVKLTLRQPFFDLRTFAIYGRHFPWDGMKPTGY